MKSAFLGSKVFMNAKFLRSNTALSGTVLLDAALILKLRLRVVAKKVCEEPWDRVQAEKSLKSSLEATYNHKERYFFSFSDGVSRKLQSAGGEQDFGWGNDAFTSQ